jgi:two-component system, cell cycle response regulator CpdR
MGRAYSFGGGTSKAGHAKLERCTVRAAREPSGVGGVSVMGRGLPMASPYTVLLVDDEVDSRESMAHLLGSRGFDVLVAQSGHEAMRLLAQIRADVLLVDIVMPDLNGIELAKQAKLVQPDLKVMFITGYLSRAAEAEGFGKLLFKPVRDVEIDTELRNLLGGA